MKKTKTLKTQPLKHSTYCKLFLAHHQEILRHILLGDYGAILRAIHVLAACKYAEPKQWSQPIPTGRSGEYLSILTKREATSPTQES